MSDAGERKARATLPRVRPATAPKAGETPAEHIRNALSLLMNPYFEGHGSRIFSTEQVGDISRLLWQAVNKLEGRADP
jgi:hypothetical protein